MVLAGDHCQLPPTVRSDDAQRRGLGISLFERLAQARGEQLARRLDVQYRMHRSIMEFSSDEFYESGLIADSSVKDHLLTGLSGVTGGAVTETPLEFIDTAGAGYDEEPEPDGESRLNRREADLIAARVRSLVESGVPPAAIGVITPYAAQARWLVERLNLSELEVDTVDGFQGREKEAILISMVRSNDRGEIGFLADTRRMNVAMTRAPAS